MYEQYADTGLLARHYSSMKKWMDYMAGFLKDGLMPQDTYGDWCVPPEDPRMIHSRDPMRKTAPTVLGTAYFYHDLDLMSRYAARLGNRGDMQRYSKLASRLKEAFNRKFLSSDGCQYDNGTQTSSILALAFDLVPAGHRQQIFNHLVDKITQESKSHVGTGLIGCQWLMRTLSSYGRGDLAYTLALQKTYPSWGYMVEKGATTIWELWNGDTADPAMNSGNHLMLVGDLITWFYEYLAGIQPDSTRPGFKHIIMRPHPFGDLKYVRATHQSPYGPIESDWRREEGAFFWNVTVPANSTATIYVPASSSAGVMEGQAPAYRAQGLHFLRQGNGYVIFSAQSGHYSFASR
jgi:alpha-L-rhamnosidase